MMPITSHGDLVRGDILRIVFEDLDIIGIACKRLLIEFIESDGLVLDHDNWYMLSMVERSLLKIFGRDATDLLLKRIEVAVEVQHRLVVWRAIQR